MHIINSKNIDRYQNIVNNQAFQLRLFYNLHIPTIQHREDKTFTIFTLISDSVKLGSNSRANVVKQTKQFIELDLRYQ